MSTMMKKYACTAIAALAAVALAACEGDEITDPTSVELGETTFVFVVNPTVNEALANSNRIVFVRGGTYTGNINFSGSSVTLFGEGPEGGNVTLDGDVTVDGSGDRLRGARITGTLSVPGSDVGISFSSVQDSLVVDGSDAVLINTAFCGAVTIDGSGTVALGNAGMTPVPEPSDGC